MRGVFVLILLLVFSLTYPFSLNSVGSYKMQLPDAYMMPVNQRLGNHLSDFEDAEYIDDQMMRFINWAGFKGVSVAVVDQERLVFARSYGYADEESSIATTPGHLFRIASVSKLVTAVAIMKLVEDNYMDLDDKVFGNDGFFNDEQYLDIRDKRLTDITVLQLLNHSGGWTRNYGDPAFMPLAIAKIMNAETPVNLDTYIKFIVSRRLHFTPGSMVSYSNVGYMLLGEIIERVSGMKYDDYVRYHILYPNDISDMHLAHNGYEERYPNEVKYYEQEGATMILSSRGDSTYVPKVYGGNDIELLGAAGAWVASAPELAKLLTIIDGYKCKLDVLSPETIAMMTEGEHPLGWSDTKNGFWYRTGNFAGTMAIIHRSPDGLQWVFLSNTRSWQGPQFYEHVKQLMRRIQRRVGQWPEHDLFNYFSPEPLSFFTHYEH
jgi:CubicO group peptidase (beta-lactamase class C family)